MNSRNKNGQSTLEYVVVLVVIILALFAVLNNFAARDANQGVAKTISSAAQMITNATARLPQ